MTTLRCLETPGSDYPATRRHTPEERYPQSETFLATGKSKGKSEFEMKQNIGTHIAHHSEHKRCR